MLLLKLQMLQTDTECLAKAECEDVHRKNQNLCQRTIIRKGQTSNWFFFYGVERIIHVFYSIWNSRMEFYDLIIGTCVFLFGCVFSFKNTDFFRCFFSCFLIHDFLVLILSSSLTHMLICCTLMHYIQCMYLALEGFYFQLQNFFVHQKCILKHTWTQQIWLHSGLKKKPQNDRPGKEWGLGLCCTGSCPWCSSWRNSDRFSSL